MRRARVLPTLMLHVRLKEAWLSKLLLVDLVEDVQEGGDNGALPGIIMQLQSSLRWASMLVNT